MANEGFNAGASSPGKKLGKGTGDAEYSGNEKQPGRTGVYPNRLPDGSSKALTPGESARILRAKALRGHTISDNATASESLAGLEPGTFEYANALAKQEARLELEERTNGYWKETESDDNITDA